MFAAQKTAASPLFAVSAEFNHKVHSFYYKNNDLIQVLEDYLHGRKSSVQVTPELCSYAAIHNVLGILYHQTQDPSLHSSYLRDIFIYKNRQELLEEIQNIMVQNKIDYFLLKGPIVAALYPNPELRTMGDCDIVVSDRPKAARLLKDSGYEVETDGLSEWPFTKSYFRFELHDRMVYTGENYLLAFFHNAWDEVKDHQLDWNLHFVFLVEHLRKHLTANGAGIRMFMDIAVITQHAQELLDWNVVIKFLKEIKLLGFAKTVFALNQRWFGIQPPIKVPKLSHEFLCYASELIMKNGVYGYNNLERMREGTVEMKNSSELNYGRTVFSRFLHKCFPSYQALIVWPEYSFLSGRKYLLPVCWIYRLFRNAFHLSRWKKLKNYSIISKAQFERKNAELKKWGL